MNPVISEIEASGTILLPGGERVALRNRIGPGSIRVLRHAIEVSRPRLGCEVGLAFGISTLYILDAMNTAGGGRLIGCDPAQHDGTWRGGGLHSVRRAGFGDRYEFHEETSQALLPRLVVGGTRIQFAYIDGWHTFDHTLVDFFYVDQMLDVGGVVVLDDVSYPALRRLAHFIVTNRDYALLDLDALPVRSSWRRTAKKILQRALRPLVRDDLTPGGNSRRLEGTVDNAQLIALRKLGEDRRSFDHFVAF